MFFNFKSNAPAPLRPPVQAAPAPAPAPKSASKELESLSILAKHGIRIQSDKQAVRLAPTGRQFEPKDLDDFIFELTEAEHIGNVQAFLDTEFPRLA